MMSTAAAANSHSKVFWTITGLGKPLSRVADVAVGYPTLIVIRSSFGEVMPMSLPLIDRRIGDAWLSGTINAKYANDLRETTRSD